MARANQRMDARGATGAAAAGTPRTASASVSRGYRGSRRVSAGTPMTSSVQPVRYEQIAERAYEIWVAEGRPQGCSEDHWLRAERQLRHDAVRRARAATEPVE